MAFTVEDFHDLVRLLGKHPDWREELRRLVLTEDLLRLPRLVEELGQQTRLLAEAQRRTETRLEALAEAQRRTETRLEALAEAQRRTEAQLEALTARVDALAEAQQQTGRHLAELAQAMDQRYREVYAELDGLRAGLEDLSARFDRDVGRLKGSDLERLYRGRATRYFGRIFKGLRVVTDEEVDRLLEAAVDRNAIAWAERDDVLEADLVARGRLRATGQEAYLVVEVSWVVDPHDVDRAYRRAGTLQKVTGRALAAVAGVSISPEARKLAETLGVIRVTDGVLEGAEPAT